MEFTLYYEGELKSNGNKEHKHSIRTYLHPQLKELWDQPPLNQESCYLKSDGPLSIIKEIGSYKFAPLITEKFRLIAELNISLLRPEAPGSIISRGGDIDNRIKTLFDALKVPSVDELPMNVTQAETPFFCLTEDDNLFTGISINTDRLLKPVQNDSEVVLLIHVVVKQLKVPWSSFG